MADSDPPPPGPVRPGRACFLRSRRAPGASGETDRAAGAIDDALPRGVRLAGAWSWRLLVIGAVIVVAVFLIVQLRLIVIPVLIAVLLGALLVPFKELLIRHRWPVWLAILTTLLTLIVVVGGLLSLAIWQVTRQSHDLQTQSVAAYDGFRAWLTTGPLGLSEAQIASGLDTLWTSIQQDSQVFVSGALSLGSTLGHVLAGVLLTLFSVLFILIDGKGIWAWIVRVFPRSARGAIDNAGRAGWTTLRNFVKVQILVASIDALGIGLGAFFLGLPLVIPIAVLVFLGSFIPIVGAVVTGALAVFVALVFKGWVFAVIMLAVVLLVQQIEGHVLQPLIMGTAVKVHPLAVVLAVAGGSLLAGIPGALFAVPLVAVLNVMVNDISSGAGRRTPPAGPARPSGAIWETVPSAARRPRS
ncbi:permease [Leifsonia xyli subsp. xyli]|uniref:Integral membrane protein n=2 Tax=Leifsonia xyli subsp. xyli TaxID=59736 RepID=Q6ADT7_LEIXX|nr:AI-2E family transporter [Leifsonia xyli]AAT89459.1 integral membrane protein [Leifsonia xyli subsp. xyli str. CTCB07]ODA90682.1 permease [Leifsonia xyli subsp. xyli]